MPTQLELQNNALVFTTLMTVEMDDSDCSLRGSWNSDTRLEVLAHEIVRYRPDLANALYHAGMEKLIAC